MQHLINKSLVLLFLAISASTSCKKNFLEVQDHSILYRQVYVTDLKTTGDFLNGIYVLLGNNLFHGYNLIYPELIADNVKPYSNSLSLHYNWTQQADDRQETTLSSSSTNMNALFLGGYKIIRACNFVLEKVEEYKAQDIEKANKMRGQALAIRALTHFILVNVFAQPYRATSDGSHTGIPYITTSDWTSSITRSSVGENYNSIISDLIEAISQLPNSSNTLMFNKNAAKSLLARVYLYSGQYSLANGLAVEVSNAVPIMTTNYPTKLFTTQETEALFQLIPESVNYYTYFPGVYFTSSYSLQFLATSDIATILNENLKDKRRAWIKDTLSTWQIRKFPSGIVGGVNPASGAYYHTLIRSSEMYLLAAESYAKIGKEDSARYYLDAIRKRADPTQTDIVASGNALLDSVYKERRKEMAFEGFRMFDLLRLGKGVTRTDAQSPLSKSLPFPSDKAIAPIPVQDVKLAGVSQNVGY